ncbi:hypothetical protein EDB19DRAFT_1809846, partial [Suillus lakei]
MSSPRYVSMCSMTAIITCAAMPKNYIFVANYPRIMLTCGSVLIYVNTYIALLNAEYYVQVNADTMVSFEFHIRHDVYRPRPHVRASQNEELQASRKSMFQHPDDESQQPIEMTME